MKQLDNKCAVETVNKEIDTIIKLRDNLNDNLTQALDIMQQASGRVIITGMGKSGHIGKKIAASLASTGTPSFFVHPAEASHGDLGMITENDVVVAISNSGESKELVDVLNYCKRFGIPLISITKNQNSALGKAGDVLLLLPNNGEADPLGLAPTSSTTATLVLGDILTTCLIERRGFSKFDFNARHPGGKLGSILQRVSDIMHTGNSLPLLSDDATIRQALFKMTDKRFGCVGLIDETGKLIGIVTDGDLRRRLNNEMTLDSSIAKIMTQNPKTLSPETMASEAVKFLNDNQITNIFVVKDEKPIGILHIHDLLKNGVV